MQRQLFGAFVSSSAKEVHQLHQLLFLSKLTLPDFVQILFIQRIFASEK
ncbi:hypothetical protein VVMO6_02575 [Vibrio vulnificus MO6-24/O]|nr:hypothetical protein VVMO6_02575 [Vibrio vulnificus MO6-24/O]